MSCSLCRTDVILVGFRLCTLRKASIVFHILSDPPRRHGAPDEFAATVPPHHAAVAFLWRIDAFLLNEVPFSFLSLTPCHGRSSLFLRALREPPLAFFALDASARLRIHLSLSPRRRASFARGDAPRHEGTRTRSHAFHVCTAFYTMPLRL